MPSQTSLTEAEVKVLRELRESVVQAATQLDASSPWGSACREISRDLSRSLREHPLRLVPPERHAPRVGQQLQSGP